jgi:hypothetical protein
MFYTSAFMLSSFSNLPTEIITHVIRQLCDCQDVLSLRATCAALNVLILRLEEFWAKLPSLLLDKGSREDINLFIQRAGTTPLTIPFSDSWPSIRTVLSSQLHRTKSLSLKIYRYDNTDAFPNAILASSTPLLEEINVQGSAHDKFGYTRNHTITSLSFSGFCAKLTFASFANITVRGLPKTPMLRTLKLRGTHTHVSELHAMLLRLPALQHLELEEAFSLDRLGTHETQALVSPQSQLGRVRLPQLLSLSIHEQNAQVINALLHIIPPPSVCLEIYELVDEYNTEQYTGVVDPGHDFHVFKYLTMFWNMVSGKSQLPTAGLFAVSPASVHARIPVTCRVCSYPGTDITAATLHYTVGSDSHLNANPALPCIVQLTITINSSGWHCNLPILEQSNLGILAEVQYLTLLETDLISPGGMIYYWEEQQAAHDILGWLNMRKAQGSPLDSIIFKKCEDTMGPFFHHLRNSDGLARSVIWRAA